MTNRQGALQVGLVGYGLAGRVFHAPLVATTPGLALAAIVTSDPERAASARLHRRAAPAESRRVAARRDAAVWRRPRAIFTLLRHLLLLLKY